MSYEAEGLSSNSASVMIAAALNPYLSSVSASAALSTYVKSTSLATALVPYLTSASAASAYLTSNSASAMITTRLAAITSGVYTPSLTHVNNVTASTAYECQWLRVGSTVTVSGKIDLDPTAAPGIQATRIQLTVPVATTFGTAQDCGGTASAIDNITECFGIAADVTANRVEMIGASVNAANHSMHFHFTYQVI